MTTLERGPRRGRTLVTAGLLAVAVGGLAPGSALARPISWGGTSANELGPGSLLLKVENGRASVTSLQAIMACTDQGDGTESERAFSIVGHSTVTLVRNRFAFDFTASSGGRVGHVKLRGTLGSNGRGTARLDLTATARDSRTSAIIERCQAGLTYRLRRGA